MRRYGGHWGLTGDEFYNVRPWGYDTSKAHQRNPHRGQSACKPHLRFRGCNKQEKLSNRKCRKDVLGDVMKNAAGRGGGCQPRFRRVG